MKFKKVVFLISLISLTFESIGKTREIPKICFYCKTDLSNSEIIENYELEKKIYLCKKCRSLFRGKDDDQIFTELLQIVGASSSPTASQIMNSLEEVALSDQERLFSPIPISPKNIDLSHPFNLSLEVKKLIDDMAILHQKRTGRERKNRRTFWSLVEEETRTILEHAWKYTIIDEKTFTVERGSESFVYGYEQPLTDLWYQGSCAVLKTATNYTFFNFSLSPRGISFETGKEVTDYLEKNGYTKPFSWYFFKNPTLTKKDGLVKKGILKESTEQGSRKKVSFQKSKNPVFDYYLSDQGSSLMVKNEQGYIFKCPLSAPTKTFFAKGTQAVIQTQSDKECVFDFEHHHYNDCVFEQECPIATLEAPAHSELFFTQQGFQKIPLNEKPREVLFRETQPVEPGYTHRVHQNLTKNDILKWLKNNNSNRASYGNYLPSFLKKQDPLTILFNGRTNCIEVTLPHENGIDHHEITPASNHDQGWKRGHELLMTEEANKDLVLYNFRDKHIDRLDASEIPLLNDLEKELLSLGFKKPALKEDV